MTAACGRTAPSSGWTRHDGHSPRGKYDLAAEAVRWADDLTVRILTRELRAGPLAGLREFLRMWRNVVLDSDFHAGCPVLAVSVEDLPDGQTAPRNAAAAAFGHWTTLLAGSMRDHGVNAADAERVATLIVAAVEGTVAMCRAQRSIKPLDQVATELTQIVERVLP